MRFGLLSQMQVPRPWPPDQHADLRIHRETFAQALLAEEVGFDGFWLTEHHFYEEIGHSAAPEVFLGALASRTSRIRLGHAVVVLPCNHPVRVAERAATLDILSDGRLELGTGRGASSYITEAFGVTTESSREVWDEAMRIIAGLLVHEEFPGFSGRHFQVPRRRLVPRPLQAPHPPLWVAAQSPETFGLAARRGLGVLGLTTVAPETLAPAVRAYREAQAEARPGEFFGQRPNFQVAAFLTAYCDTDDRRGRRLAGAATRWYCGDNDAPLNQVRFGPQFDRARIAGLTDDRLIDEHMAIGGDPDTCARGVEAWQRLGVDQLLLMFQCGRTTHDQVMRAIELFGEKVLPRFREPPGAPPGTPEAGPRG